MPLATVRLADLVDGGGGDDNNASSSSDLTMLRVLPWIDGVNSVKQIALRADADFKLVRKAIRHLLYYGCVLLLDIFGFGAIYAPTAEVAAFVESEEMQVECARYVALGEPGAWEKRTEAEKTEAEEGEEAERDKGVMSGAQLAELYLSLKQGHSVKSWCVEHADVVGRIDVRRFITFGVIKGFLYRVHKYAVATSIHRSGSKRLTKANLNRSKQRGEQREEKTKEKTGREAENAELGKYLDGTHCFDEICTDLMISEKELTARLKAWGDVQIICR